MPLFVWLSKSWFFAAFESTIAALAEWYKTPGVQDGSGGLSTEIHGCIAS